MKTTKFILPVLALALVAGGPGLVRAEDGVSEDTTTNTTSTTEVHTPPPLGTRPNQGQGMRVEHPLMVRQGSTTGERPRILPVRPGSTSPQQRQENMQERRASTTAAHVERVQGIAGTAIDERIARIQMMLTRVGDMKEISDATRASLTSTLNAQISSLTSLKGKIGTDTSTSTLRLDTQSITKDFRIYALVLPQSAITAASDRALSVVAQMQGLTAKLEARVTASGDPALTAALADMKAKIDDAKTQALAAATAVKALVPDGGDATAMANNKAALEGAKAKIDAAQADLKAARTDVETIMKGLRASTKPAAETSSGTGAQQ